MPYKGPCVLVHWTAPAHGFTESLLNEGRRGEIWKSLAQVNSFKVSRKLSELNPAIGQTNANGHDDTVSINVFLSSNCNNVSITNSRNMKPSGLSNLTIYFCRFHQAFAHAVCETLSPSSKNTTLTHISYAFAGKT